MGLPRESPSSLTNVWFVVNYMLEEQDLPSRGLLLVKASLFLLECSVSGLEKLFVPGLLL
jgi:hypothetical protein